MQAVYEGQYLYIYSGREYETKNPDITKVGEEDPFSQVEILRVNSIHSVGIDHKTYTVTLHCSGRPCPLVCTFGSRNCYKINCFSAFLEVLQQALSIPAPYIWDLKRRNSQTALSVQRCDQEDYH